MVNVLKECDYHQSDDERKGNKIKKSSQRQQRYVYTVAMQYVHIYVQAARRHLLLVCHVQCTQNVAYFRAASTAAAATAQQESTNN